MNIANPNNREGEREGENFSSPTELSIGYESRCIFGLLYGKRLSEFSMTSKYTRGITFKFSSCQISKVHMILNLSLTPYC